MSQSLSEMSDPEIIATSRLFGLLGDPTRVRILMLLSRAELNVTKLCGELGLPQPTVSHHLGLLRRGGLLTSRRDGKAIHYSPDPKLQFVNGSEMHIEGPVGLRIRVSRSSTPTQTA